jgi:8-oxo-dGTP diphosphatase
MNDYLEKLPKKRMAAGVLMFNEKGELLILKTSYKNHWTIPGGVIEGDESPKQAGIREVNEEIGLNLSDVSFVCVDYTRADKTKNKNESLQFIFSAGKLSGEQMRGIKIDGKEIVEHKFVPPEKATELLGGYKRSLVKRLSACLEAIKKNQGIYLEDGIES